MRRNLVCPSEGLCDYCLFQCGQTLFRGLIVRAFVLGSPDNAFSRLERGELTLSQVSSATMCVQLRFGGIKWLNRTVPWL